MVLCAEMLPLRGSRYTLWMMTEEKYAKDKSTKALA